MPRQERRGKAGGEFRLDADQALLGAGDLGGVAGEEVIHRLRRRQLGDRRHHAEGVGGEQHDVLRHAGAAGARGVRNKVERIGGARVLGLRLVVEVADARVRIEHDVFKHGAEAVRGGVDFRLRLGGKLDALGVAAAFEIEDALRAPAVLVVADQRALGIGGERRLAGAGKAEEQRHIAARPDIGRAVHRHHAVGRQVIVQHGEHRLLHLAGVVGAADQNDAPGEIERDDGLAANAMAFRIGLERRQAEDGEIRYVMGEARCARA